MWKSQLGSKQIKTITAADDDDDWETDPDFVVSGRVVSYSEAAAILPNARTSSFVTTLPFVRNPNYS